MEGQHQGPQNNGTSTTTNDNNHVVSPHSPLPPPPGRAHHDNMYIVQFPKDQVYRVPPQENAFIVESYRNTTKDKKKKKQRGRCCPRFLLTVAIILVTIVAVVGITLATLFFVFNPKGPTFTITRFEVKNVTRPPHYEIYLKAKNPNKRLGIVYVNSDVSMLFDNTKVANGKFTKLMEQGIDASTQFKVVVTRTIKALPKKMAKKPVEFELDMNLGVRMTASGLKTWVMTSDVVCNFDVNNLGKDSKILSQECVTNFKQY